MKKFTWDPIFRWSQLSNTTWYARRDLRPFAGLYPTRIAVLGAEIRYLGKPNPQIMAKVYQAWNYSYNIRSLFFMEFDTFGPIRRNRTGLERLSPGRTIQNYIVSNMGFNHTWPSGLDGQNPLWEVYHPTYAESGFIKSYSTPGWVTSGNFHLPLYGLAKGSPYISPVNLDRLFADRLFVLCKLRGRAYIKPTSFSAGLRDAPSGHLYPNRVTIQDIPAPQPRIFYDEEPR